MTKFSLKCFAMVIVITLLCTSLVFADNAFDFTAEHFGSTGLVLIEVQNPNETSARLTIDIMNENKDTIYVWQEKLSAGEKLSKLIYIGDTVTNEYSVALNIGGKRSTKSFDEGSKLNCDFSYNEETTELVISGTYVFLDLVEEPLEISFKKETDTEYTPIETGLEFNGYNFTQAVSADELEEGVNYIFKVSCDAIEKIRDFTYINLANEDNLWALDALKGADKSDSATDNLAKALKASKDVLGLSDLVLFSGEDFGLLANDATALKEVATIMVYNRKDTPASESIDAAMLKEEIVKAALVYSFNSAGDDFDGESVLSAAEDIIEPANLNVAEIYSAHMAQSADKMIGKNLKGYEDFVELLEKEILLGALNTAEHWTNFKGLIDSYDTFMGFDDYDDLSGNDFEKLYDLRPYESIEKLVSECEDAAKKDSDGLKDSNKPSSNKTVGSTKFSNTQTTVPVVTPPVSYDMFVDLAGVEWAKTAINELAKKGVVNGVGDGRFNPNAFVTREEFVKMLVGALGLTAGENSAAEFADVQSSMWYASYIDIASSKGIATGKGDGTFGIGDVITRQDAATMLYRAIIRSGKNANSDNAVSFADEAQIADYAKEAVDVLSGKGIINGTGNGTFLPLDMCTRAQAAKIVYGVLGIQ